MRVNDRGQGGMYDVRILFSQGSVIGQQRRYESFYIGTSRVREKGN